MPELMWQKLVRLASGQFPEIVIFTEVMPRISVSNDTYGNIPEKDTIYGWVKAIDFLRYEVADVGIRDRDSFQWTEDALMAWTWDWILFSEKDYDEGIMTIRRLPRHPNSYYAYRKEL